MAETIKSVMRLSELLKNLYPIYEIANPHQKEEFIKEIFSELTINGEVLEYKCKKGFKPLASRFVSIGEPIVPTMEHLGKRHFSMEYRL